MRLRRFAVVGVLVLCATSLVIGWLRPAPAQDRANSRDTGAVPATRRDDRDGRGPRLREGTRITDHMGRFLPTGDGAIFQDESQVQVEFGCLPNLNLERVVRMLRSFDEPTNVRWSVSGLITEYAGRNYLLVSKAIYKANTAALLGEPDSENAADER